MLELRPDLAQGLKGCLHDVPPLGREPNPLNDLRALVAIGRMIRTFRPHILHTHTAKAGTLGRLAGIALRVPILVHTFHGTVFQGHFAGHIETAIAAWERLLARRTDALLAVSPSVASQLIDAGLSASRVRVVPLGLDLQRFETVPPLRADARPVVSLVARLVPVKDVPLFLRATALCREQFPDLEVRVIGDGPLRDSLLAASPPWARFLGNRSDLPELLSESKVVALSSRSEGSPVALIEALAAGRCVVAVPVGGVVDILKDRPGAVLVASRSPADLAEGIARGLTDRSLHVEAQRFRSEVVSEFSMERLLGDLADLYDHLWQTRRPA